MDKSALYRHLIRQVLQRWSEFATAEEGCENLLVFDDKRERYAWIYSGWKNSRHFCDLHACVDVRDGKIHIFCDNVSFHDHCVATDLVADGVPEEDLVLERIPASRRAIANHSEPTL